MHLESPAEHAQSIEIKSFRYFVAGRTAAEIEILCFADGMFAGQGVIILQNDKQFATSLYNSLDEALRECYAMIENNIKDDEWVLSTIKELQKDR